MFFLYLDLQMKHILFFIDVRIQSISNLVVVITLKGFLFAGKSKNKKVIENFHLLSFYPARVKEQKLKKKISFVTKANFEFAFCFVQQKYIKIV